MSDCPESVAYQLMKDIFSAEASASRGMPDRARILDTYAECLKVVKAEPAKAPPAHSRGSF